VVERSDRHRPRRVASREVAIGCGVLFAERRQACRVRSLAERELFPPPPRCCVRPSTGSVSQAGFILPCRTSSSEFLHHGARPTRCSDTTCPGFLPSARRHRAASTGVGGSHTPASRSVLRLSQPLDGLLRPQLADLFHSAATYRVLPRPGVSPDTQPPSLFERSSLLAVARVALTGSPCGIPGCHAPRARLRGLAPRADALRRFGCSPSLCSLPSSGFPSSRCSPCAP
jgi:hypothetical protein